ncbi:hypothetical protein RclHR1_13860009 [Rhizophagus clarus]|uniref:RNase H type-1 domain-containing protein n=1 Tax=Rhizophagus clarus TaxID=94130 RepID=A0A2Z6QB46_9GLOM|nr:hypothetical protein RclHR1_13860009 [Rhizophagus clarus]
MPNNVARRGRGSFNPNSRKASRHERKKDNNNSDNSGSDGKNTVQQKRFRTISEQAIDEDVVAGPAVDVEVEGPSSPSKENNTASASLSSHPNMAAALSAPNDNTSDGLNASMHARTMTPASPPNASPDKATEDDPPVDQFLVQSPTFSIDRNDFQAAAAPNSAPETLKNFATNKALIEAKARDAYVGAAHQQFPDLVFHAHDPKQLRSDEDLRAIQVTDIPFFLTKDNIMSYFRKFDNIQSCRVYSRKNAKVQQARIVYDSALSITHFDTQWAIYCFSTCLRVTPCHYTVDQKSSRRAFVATLTQLPPNTKDIDLALLTRDLGAKAVNVPLSLNSYKPKRWAYVTFNSQETMDAAMEQIISFRGHTLQWNLPDNTNKLCYRCGKLGCAPSQCPSHQDKGRTRGRNPVVALKERFNINQPARPKERSRSGSRSHSRSKGPGNSQSSQPHKPLANTRLNDNSNRDCSKSNDKCDRSVSFFTVLRSSPPLSPPDQATTMSPHEAANILSLLKSLQQDMADVRDRITALELNDRFRAPISAPVALPDVSSISSTSHIAPSSTQTHDEIQAINAKHLAIENKLDMLANSISGSRDFVKKQIASECNSFAATLRPAKLSAKQVVYLYNSVLIPKLEYRMQVTHLSASDCYAATRSVRSLVKHKANFSRSLPNPILYLSQALGLINLSSHLIQCHVNNLFLMANSSTPFIQRLFIYRLMLIQFRFLIPISPLMVDDWSLWSNMNIFNVIYRVHYCFHGFYPLPLATAQFSSTLPDLTLPGHTPLYLCMSPQVFKACLKVLRKRHLFYLSQLIAPSGSHLISWTAYRTAYIAQLEDKRGRSLPHKWYLDIKAHTTLPGSHDQLFDQYVRPPSVTSSIVLLPGATTTQKNRHWLVTLDGNGAPLFGKQLSVQPKKDTCVIVHWISDCLSSPGDVVRLRPCPGCDAHVPFPSASKYSAVPPRCTFKISLLRSMILPTNCERIRQSTLEVISPHTWADLSITVIPYYRLPLPSGSHYRYYTDGSLINLGTPEVSMGWSWVQIIPDAGYLNSVATYAHGTIRNWPSSTRAEAAAIYAALSVTPADSTVTIYTDSQAAIDGLRLCASSSYSNSRLFYKTTNFELWASIERLVHSKSLAVFPVKVKGHDGNYWNEFADSLANSAHHSDTAPLLPVDAYTSSHPVRLVYDNVVCESNPRRLFKLHFQATFLKDLLSLKRFQFVYCLFDSDDYVVDWELTWFTLNFSPAHDASFQASHAARHYTFKFKLFLDDLPLLEKLKVTRSDLYIDLLTCRSCRDRMEDLMHLILCSKRRSVMHQILQSYQNHLFSKLREAGEMADQDPTPLLRKLSSLSCWTISSSNWPSAMKVVAAIHNNFIQKLRTRIWNPRTYDKSKWEDAMNITLKLKTTPRPSNLPATSYVPFSSLPPPTHLVTSRDSEVDWIKNSMTQGWDVDFYSGRDYIVLFLVSFIFFLHYLSKRLSNYTVFSSVLDTSQHVRSSGGVSLFIENSLASHVHTYTSFSSRLLSVDLYFKGNVKLRIFVVYIPPTSDQSLRDETIDLLILALSDAKRLGFHHAVCGDFNMHLDQFYPLFFNQPQIASKHIHRLFNFLLTNGYVDFTPINFSSTSLGTYHHTDVISRIDYVWSCPLLKRFILTSVIFDVRDLSFSDHNPVITYYDFSFLSSSLKPARARQLQRRSRRIFSFDSVTPLQWDDFSAHVDNLCNISPVVFASWHVNRMCEYLHTHIIAGANAILPARTLAMTIPLNSPKI